MTNTIIVTGGAGFIGSNFVHLMIDRGFRVVTLDALTYSGNITNLADLREHPAHRFVHGSITDQHLVRELFREEKPAAMLNLAAESHVDRSIDYPGAFIETNILGVYQLLETIRTDLDSLPEKFRFLHVSTDEVFGSILEGAATEDSPFCPNSPYAASKASAGHLVRAYHRTYGLPVLLSNCSNNYGPCQFPEKLIPLMILNALKGRPLPVYGDGRHVRDWLYVGDHCEALSIVLEKGRFGQTYNIGGNALMTNLEIVKKICAILDRRKPSPDGPYERLITHVEDRPGHDFRYSLECGKIERELKWKPSIGLDEGLEKTVIWYLDRKDWWHEIDSQIYDGERLGLSTTS